MSTIQLWLRAAAEASALREQLTWMEGAWLRAEADADFWYAQANNPGKAAQLRRQLNAATSDEIPEAPTGDEFTVATNSDDGLSIKLQSAVWVAELTLTEGVAGEHDRTAAIDSLIHALEQLRDNPND